MSAVNQNIHNFYSVAQRKDFLRDINFRITALNFRGDDKILQNDEFLYAKGGQLPGRKVENIQVPYLGLNFNVAGTSSYEGSESYKLTFFCDAAQDLRFKLEKMVRRVYDDYTSTGDYKIAGPDSILELSILDKQLNEIRKVKLIGFDIRSVDGMEFKVSGGKGDVMEISTTVSFHYYTVGDMPLVVGNVQLPGIGVGIGGSAG